MDSVHSSGVLQHCCSIAAALQAMLDNNGNAGYELLCFAQQDFKIVHSYFPALLAMLKDEIYFLLHLQQHGLQHCCSIASNAG
jgi:hypothetical protein